MKDVFAGGAIFVLFGTILTLLFNRHKTALEARRAKADAEKIFVDAVTAVDDHLEQARKNGEGWYAALVALRRETQLTIGDLQAQLNAAQLEKVALEKTIADQGATIKAMEAQLNQQTIDRAKVEIAERYIAERDEMLNRIAFLEGEVHRLTAALQEEQLQRAADQTTRAALDAAARSEGRPHD